MTDDAERPDLAPRKEPAFNAPLMAVVLPLLIVGCYALQSIAGDDVQSLLVQSFGLNPLLLRQGHFELLFTYMFLHGSWSHALFNAMFCLIFTVPLVKAMGKGIGGGLSFLVFFAFCGVAAGLIYSLLNMTSNALVIGSSAAIYALIGASTRIGRSVGKGEIVPLFNKRVLMQAAFWCGLNLITFIVPFALPFLAGGADARQVWQAHIAGYLFGVLVIGHWLKAFHPRFFTRNLN